MLPQILKMTGVVVILGVLLYPCGEGESQQPVASAETPTPGVEVQARGPVHEAFAAPSVEPKATPLIAKKPPAPIEEMPPDEKPEGDVIWVAGYWAFDDERNDFLWVSGCWRTKPPSKEWMAGYWREQAGQWQWVPGFWNSAPESAQKASEVTYYPEPPAPPAVAAPAPAPDADSFYVPGYWVWQGDRYAWRAGYWGRVRAGYVYVPSYYRWTPFGYVYVAGYWDLAVTRRGILYAPVTVDVVLAGPRFVFTPRFAVCDTIVLDALFVRPAYCHYYFGDYYGPVYARCGFESCVVYSRRCYDPVIVYQRWEYRNTPGWLDIQINLCLARDTGRAPCPPRTLVQQNTIIQNTTNVTNVYRNTVIAPTKTVAAARGQKTVALDAAHRAQVQQAAHHAREAAVQERRRTESGPIGQNTGKPRVAAMNVPHNAAGLSLKSAGPAHKGPTVNAPHLGTPNLPSKNQPPTKGPNIGPNPNITNVPHHPSVGPMPPTKNVPPPPPKKGHDDKKKGHDK